MCGRTRLKLAKQHKKQWLREEDIVEEGGGGWKVKKRHTNPLGDVFIKALIDGESSQY